MTFRPCFVIMEEVRKEYASKVRAKRINARIVLLERDTAGIVIEDSLINMIRAYFILRKCEKTAMSNMIEEI